MRRLTLRAILVIMGLVTVMLGIGGQSLAWADSTTATPTEHFGATLVTQTATGTIIASTLAATTAAPTSVGTINTTTLAPTTASTINATTVAPTINTPSTVPATTVAPTVAPTRVPPTFTKRPPTATPTKTYMPVIVPPTTAPTLLAATDTPVLLPATSTPTSIITNVAATDTPTNTATATPTNTVTAIATIVPTVAPKPTIVPPPTASTTNSSGVTWLKVVADTTKDWTLTPDPQDALRATLTAKDPSQFEGSPKRIFVLIPKASPSYDQGLRVLARAFLDKRFAATFTLVNFNGDATKGKAALALASAGNFDLILSMGSDATAFVHDNYRNGKLPVVTVLSKDPVLLGQMPNYTDGSGTNIAYTSVNAPLDLQMAYLTDLKPNLKNIAIMYEKSNKSAIETQVEPLRKAATARGITVLDVMINDTTKARAELQSGIPAAQAKMRNNDPTQADSIFWITGSTSVIAEIDTISDIAERVAVLGVFPELVKEGDKSAVLSIGVSFDTNTRLAAAYATDILSGKVKPSALPVGLVRPPDIAINFLKARQIGLKIPFSFFESASFIYDQNGKIVRSSGK